MARPLRLQFPGGVYHVTARGNGRQAIFADDRDRERFLAVLASVVDRYHVICHAYCMMENHYHLLLETPEANLSRAMRQLNGVYSQGFNRRHGRPGHVLEGRFHARVVDREGYLREVCRYVVLNPVRAGLVAHPRQWRWSSYRATAGEAPVPRFLTVDWVLALGETAVRGTAERRYREFVEAGLGAARELLDGPGLVVGGEAFRARLRERAPDAGVLAEVPRAQRFALRPSLAELFAGVESRRERNARCVAAVREHGYSAKAVADFLGLHYATVSRVVWPKGGGRPSPGMLEFKT
jgi:REP element-mobilizing transposase RayT